MNKKGMTLMELIVSIAMLSVSLVFIYSLIANLQRKKTASDNYTNDLIKIAEIENQIQKEFFGFINYGEKKVRQVMIESANDGFEINIIKGSESYIRSISIDDTEKTIKISVNRTDTRKWSLSSKVYEIEVEEEYYTPGNKQLVYQYNIYLKDEFEKVIDSINIPVFIKGDRFPVVLSSVT